MKIVAKSYITRSISILPSGQTYFLIYQYGKTERCKQGKKGKKKKKTVFKCSISF